MEISDYFNELETGLSSLDKLGIHDNYPILIKSNFEEVCNYIDKIKTFKRADKNKYQHINQTLLNVSFISDYLFLLKTIIYH